MWSKRCVVRSKRKMNRAQANSQAAADYAKKKKEQLERANRLRMERNSQQTTISASSSRPNSNSSSSSRSNQQLLMYDGLDDPRNDESNERVKISQQDYQFIDQQTLERQAKAKHERDIDLFHQAKANSKNKGTDVSNPRVTASSIISDPYSLSHIRSTNAPYADGERFFVPPSDESGRLIDLSDRPLLCISSNLRNEVIIGSSDHALYAIDVNHSTRGPIKMYSKSAGHTDWITGVAHLPDGRVISSSMDGKLCLWDTNRRNCVDLFGHQGSITKVVADTSNNVAISVGYDGKILIWSISPAQSISQQRRSGIRSNSAASSTSPAATLVGHKSPILECNYHNNGGMRGVLASGDREGKVIIWEIESGAMIARYKGHNGSVTSLDTIRNSNEDKTYFMTGGSDGMVKLWDSRVKSSVVKIPAHANNGNSNPTNSRNYSAAVACLSSIGDNYFVSGGSDNSLVLCDIRMSSSSGEITGEGSGAADSQCIVDQYQHCRNGIYSLCVIGNNCVAVGDGVGMVLVYDVTKSGNEALKYGLSASSNGGVRGITCLDGKIVTAAEDGKVLIYSY